MSDKNNLPQVASKVKSFSQKFESGSIVEAKPLKPIPPTKTLSKTIDTKINDNLSKIDNDDKKCLIKTKPVDLEADKKIPLEKLKPKPISVKPFKPSLENKMNSLDKLNESIKVNATKPQMEKTRQTSTTEANSLVITSIMQTNKLNKISDVASSGITPTANIKEFANNLPNNSDMAAKHILVAPVKNSFLQDQLAKSKLAPKVVDKRKPLAIEIPKKLNASAFDNSNKLKNDQKIGNTPIDDSNVKENNQNLIVNKHETGAETSICEETGILRSHKQPTNTKITSKPLVNGKISFRNEQPHHDNSKTTMNHGESLTDSQSRKEKSNIIKTYKCLSIQKMHTKPPRKPARPPIVNLNSLSEDMKEQIKNLTKSILGAPHEVEMNSNDDIECEEMYEDLEDIIPTSKSARPISLLTEEQEREEEERFRNKCKPMPFLPPRQEISDQSQSTLSRRAVPPIPKRSESISEEVMEEMYDDISNNREQADEMSELYEELG